MVLASAVKHQVQAKNVRSLTPGKNLVRTSVSLIFVSSVEMLGHLLVDKDGRRFVPVSGRMEAGPAASQVFGGVIPRRVRSAPDAVSTNRAMQE